MRYSASSARARQLEAELAQLHATSIRIKRAVGWLAVKFAASKAA
jgi:hypothetical protein